VDADDLEPHHQSKPAYTPVAVTGLSIEELGEYIEFLENEIVRTKQEIDAKKSSIDAAAQLFKS
jgi:uncharacterized small protein (DUF1192 family)